LHLLGQDTTALGLADRKALLRQAIEEGNGLRVVPELEGDAEPLVDRACRDGWEGIIAKRLDSPYRSGRSGDWRKLKCAASQELVIGGWTEPRGSRIGFGALLVGVHDDTGLRYAGKVGTGFTSETLASLKADLVRREVATSPFVDNVREKMAHWVRPDLVADIAFGEWTTDGRLRHPRFQGLRPDKDPAQVRRETPGEK
jgi:ATP-dependent DNA ligase